MLNKLSEKHRSQMLPENFFIILQLDLLFTQM